MDRIPDAIEADLLDEDYQPVEFSLPAWQRAEIKRSMGCGCFAGLEGPGRAKECCDETYRRRERPPWVGERCPCMCHLEGADVDADLLILRARRDSGMSHAELCAAIGEVIDGPESWQRTKDYRKWLVGFTRYSEQLKRLIGEATDTKEATA